MQFAEVYDHVGNFESFVVDSFLPQQQGSFMVGFLDPHLSNFGQEKMAVHMCTSYTTVSRQSAVSLKSTDEETSPIVQ